MAVLHKLKPFLLILSVILYFLNHVHCQECSKHMTSNENHIYRRLFGFLLETWTGIPLHDCARWCLSDRRCKSFNHREELNVCDLNYETADNVDPMYMIEYELSTWHYFDRSTWEEVFDIVCDDLSCLSSDRCLRGYGDPFCYENPPRCPNGYLQFEQKCYLYTNAFVDWETAMTHCININSTLLTLRTLEENVYIVEMIHGLYETFKGAIYRNGKSGYHTTHDRNANALTNGHPIWVGAWYFDNQYVFYPELDAVNMSYATWTPWFDEAGYCMVVKYYPEIIGAWRTGLCSASSRFFCEKDLTI